MGVYQTRNGQKRRRASRGIVPGIISGLVGVTITAALVAVAVWAKWKIFSYSEFDQKQDFNWWRENASWPLAGVFVYCSLSAFVTTIAKPKIQFAKALVFLFVFSVPLSFLLGALVGVDHPCGHSQWLKLISQLLTLGLPPSFVAFSLLIWFGRERASESVEEKREEKGNTKGRKRPR